MNERAPLGHVLGKRALVYIGILAFAFVLLLVLNASSGNASAAGPTYVYEDITGDASWTEADSPYIVNDSIEITSTGTLTIGANVTVMVDAGESITISGTLIAEGTADEMITFTSNETTPAYGDWYGLFFNSDSSGSILSYVMVEYAQVGVEISNTSVSISNVELVHNYGYGLYWAIDDGSDLVATLSNVNASDTYDGTGIFIMVDGGSATVTITDCLAEYNYVSAIVVQATGDVDVTMSDTTVMYTMNVGVLLYTTSGNINADLSNIEVAYSSSFGVLIWAPNGDATVTVDPSEISGTDEAGLQVEALGSVDLTVVDTTFTECYIGIAVYADTGPATVDLTNVAFNGCTNGLIVEVTNGDAIINLDETTMSAPEEGGYVMYYPVEVEAEYDIISPDAYTSGSEMYVDLPFDFPFAGGVYDYVYVFSVGVISVGQYPSGPFPVDIYSSSQMMIIPCQDYFTADSWPYYGYKVYDDRIVFQWYVWVDYSYLKNLFEVVLYPSGDIQFNYAAMEMVIASDYSYDYGIVTGGYMPVVLNDLIDPNVYDMDYRSVYFDMEMFNGGWGIYADVAGDVEATITDSTIGHFVDGGVLLMSDNGAVSVDVMNSTIEYVLSDAYYGAGLAAASWNGTLTATIEESTFSHILYYAVVMVAEPLWGGERTVTIEGCTFEEIAGGSVWIMSYIEDDDGFNEVVILDATTTITENTFNNAGYVSAQTYVIAGDSAWDVTLTETMTNNTFTGSPPYLGILPDGIGAAELGSGSEVISYVDGSSLEVNVEMTGNEMESPMSVVGPMAPLQGGPIGIAVESYVEAVTGEMNWQVTAEISGNTLTSVDGWYWIGILIDAESYAYDGELNSTIIADVVDNEILGDVYTVDYCGVEVYIMQICELGSGNGTIAATVNIEGNTIQNAWWAIWSHNYAEVYNQWGTQTADFVVSVADNQITGESTYGGIDVDIESYAWYESYFPPYETEVTSTQTTTYSVDVTGNWVDAWNQGIYVYTDFEAQEDWYGLLANAVLDANGTINISDNTVNMTSPAWYGIYADLYSYALYGTAETTTETALTISGNTVISPGMDIGYTGYGIWVYDEIWADTEQLSFEDAPMVDAMLDASVADNTVSGCSWSIHTDVLTYAEYGRSSAVLDSSVVISGNEVSDIYEYGIYYYNEMYVSEYSYYDMSTNAIIDAMSTAEISNNVVSWLSDSGEPVGILAEVYWDDWAVEDVYLAADLTVDVVANTVTGVAEDWSEGIEAGGESDLIGVFTVADNTISNVYNGIDVWYCNVVVADNVITTALNHGVDVWYCIGTVSGNTITGAGEGGICLWYCWSMSVDDNAVDESGNGIYLNDTDDTTITGNTLTNNGLLEGDTYGFVAYYAYNITISGNEITGNLYGMYVYYSDTVVVEANTVNGNVYDGADFYDVYSLTIEGNTFSENGEDGVWMYYCYDVVFGNNTVNENSNYGLYVYQYYETTLTIYNGVYAENTYGGVYVEMEYWAADWIVDAAAEVRNNDVYFDGDVMIVSGGVLTLDSCSEFFMGYDYRDGRAKIIVEEGGTLVSMNSVIDGYDYYELVVLGTLDMESSAVYDAKELYLGPTSSAEIRTSTIASNLRNGIHVDDCSPSISGSTIAMNEMDGIFIEGANAAPNIMDCIISMNERGVYAYESSLANVVDNLIVMNYVAGIYAYDSDGKVHDNILLFNPREVWIKDSIVSVQDNQIGYSVLVDTMAKYLPLLSMEFEVPINGGFDISPELMMAMMLDHIGIYAENSEVSASDNVYGLLTFAVYVVDSQLTFSDRVVSSELTIPYFDSLGMLWNITVPIVVYDGIYAAGSSVTVNGAYIEVLDDAIFLEASTADITDTELNATDVDVYLTDGSTASATEVTFDGKILVQDTSVMTVNYKLTVVALDQDGLPVGGVWIVVWDAANEEVAEGATGDDGKFVTYVVGFIQTSAGKNTAMNPYVVNASFDQGSVLKSVSVDGPTELIVEVPVDKPATVDIFMVVAIVLIVIGLTMVLMLVLKP